MTHHTTYPTQRELAEAMERGRVERARALRAGLAAIGRYLRRALPTAPRAGADCTA